MIEKKHIELTELQRTGLILKILLEAQRNPEFKKRADEVAQQARLRNEVEK